MICSSWFASDAGSALRTNVAGQCSGSSSSLIACAFSWLRNTVIGWVGSRFRRLPIGRLVVDAVEKEADEGDNDCFCDEDEEGGEEDED